MEKEFKHKDGNIKVTQEEDYLIVDPTEKEGTITVDNTQPKASVIKEVENKLNKIYAGSPAVVKEFIKWLDEVV